MIASRMTLPAGLGLITCLLAAVLLAGALAPALAWAGDNDQSAPARQNIYIDPNTGDVISPPSQAGQQNAGQAAGKHGLETRKPSPDTAPTARAIHCPDGSLRMGHAEAAPGQSERQALCARPVR